MACASQVAVLGGGAVGCLWAARLAKAGVATSLLVRRPSQEPSQVIRIENVWQHGASSNTESVKVRVEAANSSGEPLGCVLVATKAYSALQALRSISPRLLPGAVCIVLSNGTLAIQEELAAEQSLRGLTVILGTTTHGSWQRAPFQIVHAGFGRTSFGVARHCFRNGPDPARSWPAVLELLRRSGLCNGAEGCTAIEPQLWRKLAANAAINPLTALWDCRNGEVLAGPRGQEISRAVASEVASLAAAMGAVAGGGSDSDGHAQQLDAEGLYGFVEQCMHDTAANYSSMHQDINAHRQTEIGYLNGWVARRGVDLGVPVPMNAHLAETIRAKEQLILPVA